MDYQKIYDQIIERAKNRILEGYSEKHHIVPVCIGGNNKKENLVSLTAREHFLAHWLLYRQNPDNKSLMYSFWMMSYRFKNFSSIAYSEAKEAFSKERKGIKIKEECRLKIIESRKKQGNPWWIGRKHSEEIKKKMSESAKTRKTTEENEAIRRAKISASSKGRKPSAEYVERMKVERKGENNPYSKYLKANGIDHHSKGKTYEKQECPHCKRMISKSIIHIKHLDNCKSKIK
jgi:hypothetical protein